jgi:pimeloyl-ACP methyl ester carboxylesterase
MTLLSPPGREAAPTASSATASGLAARQDATITLADGRRLGYTELGPRDGQPVLFFHGLGTSRVICPADEALALDLGVRLIAVDRPGIGLSEPLPGRRLLDWPADVAQLADRLALPPFAIVGWSGGGPYAAACAFALAGRVRAVAMVSAPAPISGVRGADYLRRFDRAARAAGRAPWMIRLAMWSWGRPQRRDPVRFFEESLGDMCAADQAVLSEPGLRQQMIENSSELYRQGGRGVYDEALVLARRWGFAPRDIGVPVHIWHGEQDEVVPVAMARYMASEIATARSSIYPSEGHHLLYRRWPQILGTLARA